MLSKEECLDALEKLHVLALFCSEEVYEHRRNYLKERYDLLKQLIEEHFELVKKHEMLSNTYSMLCDDYFNPQPFKFEELKVGMWIWDNKEKKCNKIIEISDDEIGFYYVMDNVTRFTCNFEENRFYPVQMANVGCE